jgi:hypothetical protein
VLALFLMGTAFVLTIAQAEPAWAYTIDRSDTQIVITSDRLTGITVHLTETWTLRSDGRVTFRVDVHNSGNTRKFYTVDSWAESPATGVKEVRYRGCTRIGGDSYDTWSETYVDPVLNPNWSRVRSDPNLRASFKMTAYRLC